MSCVNMEFVKYWIDGCQVDSVECFVMINLVMGEVIVEVVLGGEVEINVVVVVVKVVFLVWVNMLVKQCVKLMCCLGELIEQNVLYLVVLEMMDIGLLIVQMSKQFILCVFENFYFFVEVCMQVNGCIYLVDDQMLNYMLYQLVGVCVLILLWNVLFMMVIWKVVLCLVFGNMVVLKMLELLLLIVD